MVKPRAFQRRDRSGRLARYSFCPIHGNDMAGVWCGKRTSLFIGVNESGWVFRCRESDHTFAAAAPGSAPKRVDEVAEWNIQQNLLTIEEMSKRGA